jgi:secondary thiamine-phosphate synthase enzyme
MARQVEFTLPSFSRGFHLITHHVESKLPELPSTGILHIFIKHTSAGLCINENADPTVLEDFESVFDKLVPEGNELYRHQEEGPDDMPAHVKSVLSGSSIVLPITNRRINLGTWQGIYLCEFRDQPHSRKLVLTIIG